MVGFRVGPLLWLVSTVQQFGRLPSVEARSVIRFDSQEIRTDVYIPNILFSKAHSLCIHAK